MGETVTAESVASSIEKIAPDIARYVRRGEMTAAIDEIQRLMAQVLLLQRRQHTKWHLEPDF